ncbi:MAG: hypothetical protein AAGA20_03990, partial [Planctomycetota bacterium]
MTPQRLIPLFGASTLAAAIILLAAPHAESSSSPPLAQTFEVAMDGTSFYFEGPTNGNGVPANGTPFVIQGYIYPDGVF